MKKIDGVIGVIVDKEKIIKNSGNWDTEKLIGKQVIIDPDSAKPVNVDGKWGVRFDIIDPNKNTKSTIMSMFLESSDPRLKETIQSFQFST